MGRETHLDLEAVPRVEQVLLFVFFVQELYDHVDEGGGSVQVLVQDVPNR